MITTLESDNARHHDRGRIPFQLSVELAHQDFDDAFEADAVDLSSGGLSLRTPCLPEVGERLTCRFEAMPGGTRVESRGEVVWTHADGERSGEFGLRFLDIDSQTRALLDELVAERRAEAEAHGVHEAHEQDVRTQRAAASFDELRIAQLELDGVDAPLSARLLRSGGGAAVFEQRLDLLELGRGVTARAGSALGKGSVAEVSLRMEGGVPTLAVTVRFEQGKSLFGEFDWEASGASALESDTARDLEAPSEAENARSHVTMMEFEALHEVRTQTVESLPAALADVASALGKGAPVDEEAPLASDADSVTYDGTFAVTDDPAENGDRHASAPETVASETTSRERETARVLHLREDEGAWAHPVPDSAHSSALVRFLRIFVAINAALTATVRTVTSAFGPSAGKAAKSVGTAGASTATLWSGTVVPFGRDLVRGLRNKTNARPRRTTTAPAAQHKEERESQNVVRLGVIAALGMCAIALGVYALAPTNDDDAISLHRKVTRPARTESAPTPTPSAAAVAVPNTANALPGTATQPAAAAPTLPDSKINAAYASAMNGQAPAEAPAASKPAPTPDPHTVPASSPYAVDVREPAHAAAAPTTAAAPAAKAVAAPIASAKGGATHGPSFGAKNVAHAQRFVLRMNAPIKTLQGSSDKTGFNVMIPGVRSIDRAGPISARSKVVARAMVLNKNGNAELNVRFVDGKSPAFRVSGHGVELELLIAQ